MLDRIESELIFGYRMNKLTPDEKEIFKARLLSACLSRYKRKKDAVVIEHCPDGVAEGCLDTFVEQATAGWGSTYRLSMGGLGKRFSKGRKKK